MADTGLGLTYGHSGFFPGYTSGLLYLPEYEIAVALQINADETRVMNHTHALAASVVAGLRAR